MHLLKMIHGDLWLIVIISFQSAVECTRGEDPLGSKVLKAKKSGAVVVSDCSSTWSPREAQQRESVSQWHWEDGLPLDVSWVS